MSRFLTDLNLEKNPKWWHDPFSGENNVQLLLTVLLKMKNLKRLRLNDNNFTFNHTQKLMITLNSNVAESSLEWLHFDNNEFELYGAK